MSPPVLVQVCLHSTAAHQNCTSQLRGGLAFHNCTSKLHFTAAGRTCILQLHIKTALHSCRMDLHFTAAHQNCTSQLQDGLALHSCRADLHSTDAFWICMQFYSCMQQLHFTAALCDCISGLPCVLHFTPARADTGLIQNCWGWVWRSQAACTVEMTSALFQVLSEHWSVTLQMQRAGRHHEELQQAWTGKVTEADSLDSNSLLHMGSRCEETSTGCAGWSQSLQGPCSKSRWPGDF